nr:immunoglobulin heavy chain junction region [Macaca mulatta]
CSRDVPPEDW